MAPALLTQEQLLRAEQDTICLYEVFLRISTEKEEQRSRRAIDEFPPEELVRDSGTPLENDLDHLLYRDRSNSKSRTPILESEDNMSPEIMQRIEKITKSRTRKTMPTSDYHSKLQKDGKDNIAFTAQSQSFKHPADDFCETARSATPGPTDEQIAEAALKIAQVGDQIQEEYGSKMLRLDQDIQNFVRDCGQNLTYELFAAHVNELVGQDRSWTTFMFIFHLSRRIILTTGASASLVRQFFRTYIGRAFREEVASTENIATFVQARPET